MTVVAELQLGPLLAGFLPAQRWFAGRGRRIEAVRVASLARVHDGPPALVHVVAEVAYADGPPERYAVPIGLDTQAPPGLADAGRVLGTVAPEGPGGTSLVAYDALADSRLTLILLARIAEGAEAGGLRFRCAVPARGGLAAGSARMMSAEQSNTSVVFDDRLIMKLFRRVQDGINPELELTRVLAGRGFTGVAEPLGWIEDDTATVGMLQPFLAGSVEGWKLATERSSAAAAQGGGAGFEAEARELGVTTARLHLALAAGLGTVEAGAEAAAATAARRRAELAETVALAPDLARHVPRIEALFDAADVRGTALQRVHGDYHLGQVLRAAGGQWIVLDFEGEPARPIPERRLPDSPLRDVAGMLRSFDYAASFPLMEGEGAGDGAGEVMARWARAARSAFLDGYFETVGDSALQRQLPAYEIEKALYEVRYEARYRPHWLAIPLGGIDRLLAPKDAKGGLDVHE
jgi:maltokinase